MNDHDNLHTAATIGLVSGAYDGYRTYQATGDQRHAMQTGMKSAGLIMACGTLGAVGLFGAIGIIGALTSVEGTNLTGACLYFLATAVCWGLALVLYRNYRVMMKRALVPRTPVPAPRGSLTGRSPSQAMGAYRASLDAAKAPRPTSQYTYDLRTGKFHKNW